MNNENSQEPESTTAKYSLLIPRDLDKRIKAATSLDPNLTQSGVIRTLVAAGIERYIRQLSGEKVDLFPKGNEVELPLVIEKALEAVAKGLGIPVGTLIHTILAEYLPTYAEKTRKQHEQLRSLINANVAEEGKGVPPH
jgi:hypothetical protein